MAAIDGVHVIAHWDEVDVWRRRSAWQAGCSRWVRRRDEGIEATHPPHAPECSTRPHSHNASEEISSSSGQVLTHDEAARSAPATF
jgi:hypothetical protein